MLCVCSMSQAPAAATCCNKGLSNFEVTKCTASLTRLPLWRGKNSSPTRSHLKCPNEEELNEGENKSARGPILGVSIALAQTFFTSSSHGIYMFINSESAGTISLDRTLPRSDYEENTDCSWTDQGSYVTAVDFPALVSEGLGVLVCCCLLVGLEFHDYSI